MSEETDAHGKTTLKRQNTDDEPRSPKKQKKSASQDEDEGDEEENRLAWIQQQLNALQEHAQDA